LSARTACRRRRATPVCGVLDLQAIPDGVDEPVIAGIGGDRLLVVEPSAVVSFRSVVMRPQVRPPSRELETSTALVGFESWMASAIWCAEPSGPTLTHGSDARS
jgi:hypothetical protein